MKEEYNNGTIKDVSYQEYWLAVYKLAESMVFSPVFRDKISKLNSFTAGDNSDMIHEITLRIIQKTNTMIKARNNYEEEMNYKAYVSSMVSSYLKDLSKKYTYYKDDVDNGVKQSAYYIIESIFDPVYVNEDSELSIIDSLKSEIKNPEESFIFRSINSDSKYKILEYFSLVSKHKSKGEVLSLVLYGLKDSFMDSYNKEYSDNKMKYFDIIAHMFYRAGYSNFVNIYRALLMQYNDEELGLCIDDIKPFLSYTMDDFGKIDYTSPKTIRDKIYKWNNLASKEIYEYKEHEMSRSR